MSNASIRQSLISPSEVYVCGDDTDRMVTDRYMLWRVLDAPRKLADALRHLPEGAYKVAAGGAVTPLPKVTTPTYDAVARIMAGCVVSDLDKQRLTPTSLMVDNNIGATKRSRVFESVAGELVAISDTLDLAGYTLALSDKGVHVAIMRRDEIVGLVMPTRIRDDHRADAGKLALAGAPGKGVAA